MVDVQLNFRSAEHHHHHHHHQQHDIHHAAHAGTVMPIAETMPAIAAMPAEVHQHQRPVLPNSADGGDPSASQHLVHHHGLTVALPRVKTENGIATTPTGKPKVIKMCRVCGDCTTGTYFGAVVCLPCKTFFIRYGTSGSHRLRCRSTKSCQITVSSRTRCKYCRLMKCYSVGMVRKERPEVMYAGYGQELCSVCHDIANGIHFGTYTCEGCKKFFRRGLKENQSYRCVNNGNCVINPRSRNTCRRCRFNKCLSVGMTPKVRVGRPRKAQRESLLSSIQMSRSYNNHHQGSCHSAGTSSSGESDPGSPLTGTLSTDGDMVMIHLATPHTPTRSESRSSSCSSSYGDTASEVSSFCTTRMDVAVVAPAAAAIGPDASGNDVYGSRLGHHHYSVVHETTTMMKAESRPPAMFAFASGAHHQNERYADPPQEQMGQHHARSSQGDDDDANHNNQHPDYHHAQTSPPIPLSTTTTSTVMDATAATHGAAPASQPEPTAIADRGVVGSQPRVITGSSESAGSEDLESSSGVGMVHVGDFTYLLSETLKQRYLQTVLPYWSHPRLPPGNVAYGEADKAEVQRLTSAHNRAVDALQGPLPTDELLREASQFRELTENVGEFLRLRLVRTLNSFITLIKSQQVLSDVHEQDILTIIRMTVNTWALVGASCRYYSATTRRLLHVHDITLHDNNPHTPLNGRNLHMAHKLHMLHMDETEAALLSLACILATDCFEMKEPNLVEKKRWRVLELFRGYTTEKYGWPNWRIEELFACVPEMRLAAIWFNDLSYTTWFPPKSNGEKQDSGSLCVNR